MANLVPMIEIGIVEPSIATNTAGNLGFRNKIYSFILENFIWRVPYNETVWKTCSQLEKKKISSPL